MTTNEMYERSEADTAGKQQDDDAWLTACAAPGRHWFGLSGTFQTLETLFAITRWGALAWTAQGVMDRAATHEMWGLVAFAVTSALAVGAGWTAGTLAERGARAVATGLRQRLTGALLPAAGRISQTGPAEAAWAMVDLADDVADCHAQAAPLRRSAPLSMLAVLAVTAAVHWPAAIVLVLTTALLPLDMRLAGLFAQHGADRQAAATRHLNAVVLDSFRGMRTLRELGAVGRRGQTLTTAAERLNKATMSVLRRAFLSGMIMDVVVTFSIAVNATYIGLSLFGYVQVPHAPRLTLFTGLLVLLLCPMYFAPMRAAAFHLRERAVIAAGVVTLALIAQRAPGTACEAEQNTRKALRAELVTAVDAWTEMASLGAAEQLAARTTARFTRLDAVREAAGRRRHRTKLTGGLIGTAALTATAVTGSAPDAATFVFVALLSLGVLGQAEQLATAAEARATAKAAHRRLTTSVPLASVPTVREIRSWSTEQGIGFADYHLPPMALRPGRVLGATVARGAMLVVTGRSGSGKSTLLRAFASSLRQATEGRDGRPAVVAVAADDHLFTGTIGSNWRLADAVLTDDKIDEHLSELWLNDSGLTATTSVGPGERQLSGGELRRVCLGRALARHPHVLIVDEPTTGLDDRTGRHLLGILQNLPDTTVVIALHDVPACLRQSGHVMQLSLDRRGP